MRVPLGSYMDPVNTRKSGGCYRSLTADFSFMSSNDLQLFHGSDIVDTDELVSAGGYDPVAVLVPLESEYCVLVAVPNGIDELFGCRHRSV